VPSLLVAMAQVLSKREYGFALRSALELLRSVNGKAWENTATIFRQIPTIGPKSMKKLEQVGCASKCNAATVWGCSLTVTAFDDLIKADPSQINNWLNRANPYGFQVLAAARNMPRFCVTFV
jgi:ATP-dependent DNA helicase HFM1/MER3